MKKMNFEVTINAPDDESVHGIRAYMREAIASWSGQFDPNDSLFGHFYSKAGYKNISIKHIPSNKKETVKSGKLDLTPSWRTAVLIYCEVLQNPKASPEAHRNAREDLLKLADAMDRVNQDKKTIASLADNS